MNKLLKALFGCLVFVTVSMADEGFSFKITRAELVCTADPAVKRLEVAIDRTSDVTIMMHCADNDDACKDNRKKLDDWVTKTFRSPSNYRLTQIVTGASIDPTAIYPDSNPELEFYNSIALGVTGYELDKKYVLFAKDVDLSFKEKKPSFTPFIIPIEVNPNCETPAEELVDADKPKVEEPKTPGFKDYLAKPPEGGTPQLKIDFSMQGSKRHQVLYSFGANFRPYTRRRLGFGGYYELTPFFVETEYQINASPADKKNVLGIGVLEFKWTKILRDDGDEHDNILTRHSPGFIFTITPKLETEWGFRERNLLLSPRATMPMNLYQSRRTTLRVDPFVGFEYGFVWASQVSKPGKSLQRPLAGFGITANFLRNADQPLFGAQIDYIRRFFLKPELSYGVGADNKLVPDRESRRPRDDLKARFFINATKLFSPFVEYEYGRVPPKYNLINSSFKTGVTFNVDVVWKSFN